MTKYRFIIRYHSSEEDMAVADTHCGLLKAEVDRIGTTKGGKPIFRKKSGQIVFRKDKPPSEPQRDGEVSIIVATQKEKDADDKFAEYMPI